jgi:predicted nucleotide-binding protein (sugar kinase/HSP70/actin superfamily)
MHLGDVINDMIYQIRPFEVNKGETDRGGQFTSDSTSETVHFEQEAQSMAAD